MQTEVNKEAALVILSGGQDSSTCVFWAKQHFSKVVALTYTYGQKHSDEVGCARRIAELAGVDWMLQDLSFISSLAPNSLTDPHVVMEEEMPREGLPNTFVPGRNLFFITLAAVAARERGINHLVTGVGQTDYSGYPDCRDAFVKSLNVALNLGLEEQFIIHTPLMWLDKCETWAMAWKLGVLDVIEKETLTCYNNVPAPGCGHCMACKLREEGLRLFYERRARGDEFMNVII